MKRLCAWAIPFVALLLLPAGMLASGTQSMPMPTGPTLTPEQEAVQLYNDGISYRDKAEKLEKEAAAEPDAAKRQKLEKKALDKHESSIDKFAKATKKNPKLFQAWGSLGFAYRKTGKYPEALEAYNRALELKDGYTPAIEYRAEAYLELNRLDDVKTAYMGLFRIDRPRADELASAIDKWVEKRRRDAAGVAPEVLEIFAKWAAERKQLSSQTSALMPARQSW